MAALTVQSAALAGTALTYASAGGAGDTFVNNGRTVLYVKNTSLISAGTVTIDSVTPCDQGSDHNIAVALTANTEAMIGPFNEKRFNGSGQTVSVSYSGGTITVAAVNVG